MPREDYQERVEARRERLERASSRARRESESALGAAHGELRLIPPGQPILVGHHSEKRHRNALKRIDNRMRKGFERGKDAERLARNAGSVGTAGVSSDDPEAVTKLKARVAELETERAKRKAANAAWRKAGGKAGRVDGEWREAPFPPYSLTNLGSNIRRVKQRLVALERAQAEPPRESIEGDGFTLREDRDINRVCIDFDARVSRETCKLLRSYGFKWNRTEGCWTRLLNNGGWWNGKYLAERFTETLAEGGTL